jgi:hypothetical protein
MQLNRTRCNLRGGMFPLSTLNVRLLAALLNDGLTAYYQRVPACHEKFKTFQNGVPLYVFLKRNNRLYPRAATCNRVACDVGVP